MCQETSLAYSEILHVQLQLLNLLRVLIPGVIFNHRDVDINKLSGKTGELVVDAHGIVTARRYLVGVICSSLPLVGLHHLAGRVADRETCHTITASHHLEN